MAIKEFKDYPDASTPLSAENINEVITTILKILGLDVDTYDTEKNYGVDDFFVYQKELWRCTNETTGAGELFGGGANWEYAQFTVL